MSLVNGSILWITDTELYSGEVTKWHKNEDEDNSIDFHVSSNDDFDDLRDGNNDTPPSFISTLHQTGRYGLGQFHRYQFY
jgi:hypothetical protein